MEQAGPKTETISSIIINNLKKYSKIIFYLSFFFIIAFVTILMSENYRINKCLKNMDIYKQYLVIDSKLNSDKLKKKRLCDFYISSSFRSCVGLNQRFDYLSVDVLSSVIESGARFLWFDIFNNNMSNNAQPVVSNGYDKGNWRYTLNSLHFEDVIKRVASTAFNAGYINNYNDPLILALNLNVQNNLITLNRIKKILIKHLKNRLLPSRFGFMSKNIAETKIEQLLGRVVIFTSGGYEDSELIELINYTWEKPEIRLLSYKNFSDDTSLIQLDEAEVKDFNKNNLSIVLPEEESILTNNYDPRKAFDTGCQFICMNYQYPDQFMDEYITKFRNSSFIERPNKFLGESGLTDEKLRTQNLRSLEQSDEVENKRCPNEPRQYGDDVYKDNDAFSGEKHLFKKETDEEGLCFFSETECNPPNISDEDKIWKEYNSNSLTLGIATNDSAFVSGSPLNELNGIRDSNNNIYNNWRPKICCSKRKYLTNNQLQSKHVVTNECPKPDNYSGSVGMKMSRQSIGNLKNIEKSIDSNKHQWILPRMCNVEDQRLLRNQQYCTISANSCPDGWTGNMDLEGGWKMCCKNML